MPFNNLSKKLFQLLVFLLPTQLAFHFWPNWSYLYGIRIDYFAPAIYITDVLIVLFILHSMFLANKNFKLSSREVVLVVFLLLFSLVNIGFSEVWELSLVKWMRVYEFILLGFFIIKQKIDWIEDFLTPFSISLISFSIIAILQFSFQRSLGGVFYLLGERMLNINTVGISTVTIYGREFVRAYGTFSHPNSLAGFFLTGSAILLFSKFKDKHNLLRSWGIALSIISVLLSFSLSAYLGLVLLLFFYYIYKTKSSLIGSISLFTLFSGLIFSLLFPIMASSFKNINVWERSTEQRVYLAEASGQVIATNPTVGVGLNNFIVSLTKVSDRWPLVLQPVHNIFLLVFSEAGILGLLIVAILLFKSINISWKTKRIFLLVALVFVVFTGLFDHYWITLNQNELLLTLILAFSFKT